MESQRGVFAKTWNLVMFLLYPEKTETIHRQKVNKIIHEFNGTNEELLNELRARYTNQDRPLTYSDYEGTANDDLDRSFSVAEIRAALQRLNTRPAHGPDGVTSKTLRNLDDVPIGQLSNFIN